jgi:hypothetical protein
MLDQSFTWVDSVCVRLVECTGGKLTLREEYLSFVRASEATGENLAELFYLVLRISA